MRRLYSLFLYMLMPFVLFRLLILGIRTPAYRGRWSERFGFLPAIARHQPVIWLHAVSVGEVEATVPLMKHLKKQFPGYHYIITTVTPTGAELVNKRFGNEVTHFFLPYDLPYSVNRFLLAVRPAAGIIMETEIWPNIYYQCYRKGIPLILANARLSERSFRGYKRVRSLAMSTMNCISHVAAQTRLDADKFLSLGCDPTKVTVVGTLKFDMEIDYKVRSQAGDLRNRLFQQRPVWIAASTHEGEEEQLLETMRLVLERFPQCLLIIAPRHPPRFDGVASLCRASGFPLARKSQADPVNDDTRVYLLDSLGELLLYYACADLAFVGGSLVAAGGHNMLEPAALGLPVLAGPNLDNFQEVAEKLREAGGLQTVVNSTDLADKVLSMLDDERLRKQVGESAGRVVEENRGAGKRILELVTTTIQ